ncbi:atherin-like [Orcinus orca]|uniref:atherin-like n=1 Tax=Orcinus orca TaxID=9733 RepID=UPI0021114FD3|nr:atherin-like [Orcinus orca]
MQEWGSGGRRPASPESGRDWARSDASSPSQPLPGVPSSGLRGRRPGELAARRAEPGAGVRAVGPGRRAGRPRGLWDRWPHFLPAPTGSQRQWAPRKAARPPLGARSSGAAALRPRTRARGRAAWAARRARAAGRLRRLLGSAEVAPRGGGGAAAEEEEPGPPQPLTAARVNKPRRRRGPAAAPARAGAGAEAEAEPCPGRRPGRGRAAAPPRLRAVTLLPGAGTASSPGPAAGLSARPRGARAAAALAWKSFPARAP